ncbi:MAG: LAGLIDADG family homing endonuclease [Candidatus Heimdallarchaeota archaeon]
MLHWSTDPLLYDEEPIPYNDWLTANDVIEQDHLDKVINEDNSFSNIYGIMVRKIDFVRKTPRDRIIARFPFIILEEDEKEFIEDNILTLSELTRDYFYRSINKSIMEWKTIIQNYLEKGKLPYPIYRCSFELDLAKSTHCNTKPLLHFASARGEAFTFPTKVTNKLAYLCGVCNGDGNLRDYWVIVADETKDHIVFITKLLYDLFSKNGLITKTGGAWIVKLNLLWTVRLFNFLTDQSIDKPKYESLREPVIFQQLNEPFRSLYWRGAFDADGSFKNQIVFCSMSETYIKDFQLYLTTNNIDSHFFNKRDGGYQVNILAKDKIKFANLIGSNNPKKQKDFLDFIQKSIQQLTFQGFNKETLTSEGYFDFRLISTVSVNGLAEYFKQLSSKNSIFNKRDLQLYQSNTGITIGLLTNHLTNICQKTMPFLDKNENKITFRSGSSGIIRLPLRPISELNELLDYFIPTARGATLYNSTERLLDLRERFFVVPKNTKLDQTNKLLRRFLLTFGNYSKWCVNVEEFKQKWRRFE